MDTKLDRGQAALDTKWYLRQSALGTKRYLRQPALFPSGVLIMASVLDSTFLSLLISLGVCTFTEIFISCLMFVDVEMSKTPSQKMSEQGRSHVNFASIHVNIHKLINGD